MGRKRLPAEERRERLTIRLPLQLIDKLKAIDNYNKLIEQLLIDHFKKK